MTGIKDLAEFGPAGQNLVALCLLLVAGVLLLYAALHDVAVRTVPDWLSVAMLVLGVGLRLLDHGLLEAVIIAGITFAVLFMLWLLGFMGGGDVKLLGAVAIVLPIAALPTFIVAMSIAGALQAAIYLSLRHIIPQPDHVRPVGFGGGLARTIGDRVGREGSTVLSIGPAANASTGAVLGPREFEVDRATCRGDSGGPALDAVTGEIVGVVSRGGSCSAAGNHVYTRIDAYASLARLAMREASRVASMQETLATAP